MTKIHATIDTRAMIVFLQAARDGSFTLAGERLNMTPSAVSKAISRLEADLGATLLRRNPRSVSLTPEGVSFLPEAESLLIAIERARGVLSVRPVSQRSSLRVTMPMHFGRTVVMPQLPRFSERHPAVSVECLFVNGQLDPIEHGIDIALWFSGGPWIDSRLVIENVSTYETLICASPAYLERYGTPRKITDLEHHRTLTGIDERTGRVLPWEFTDGTRQVSHSPKASALSNSIDVLLHMALEGCGIAYFPNYVADEAIRLGKLRVILPQFRLQPCPVQIVYPRARAGAPDVMAFIALLTEAIQIRHAGALSQRRRALS
jgi:DNA-binding transcriptional LysR family regulator